MALYRFLLTDCVKKVTLVLSDSQVRPQQVIDLMSFVGNGSCEKLVLFL